MKKLTTTLLAMVMVLSVGATTMAAPAPKVKEVQVSITGPIEEVELGTVVDLSAVTTKHGQLVSDSWTGAIKTATILNQGTGEYVSDATFIATAAGTYTIEYAIIMEAGKSGVQFVGVGQTEVTYYENNRAVVVQRITIKVKEVAEHYNANNDTTNYKIVTDVTTVLSNGDIETEEVEIPFNKHSSTKDFEYTYESEAYEISETVTFKDVPKTVDYTETIEVN